MSRESESEQTQRTVAELLAQYGANSGEVTPRRRRRRAEETSETGPQAIIDRVNSDSGRLMAIRDEPAAPAPPPPPPPPPPSARPQRQRGVEAERTAYQPPVTPPPAAPPPAARPEQPARPDLSRLDPSKTESGRRRAPDVDPAEETRVVPPIVVDYPAEKSRPNLAKSQVKPSNMRPAAPVAPPMAKPPMATPPAREPVTEVMPRITDKLTPNVPLESLPTESVLIVPPAPPRLPPPLPDQTPEDWFGDDDEPEEAAEQESTQYHQYVDLDEDDDASDDYQRRDFQRREFDDEPAGLADVEDDDEEPAERSAGKEWLVMIGQLAVGVLGGAALWLGFSFLWRTAAPAALVVALGVTVGLVMVVRRIRRADDLQTTVLAVLVGLIVTVSPAAMLLVKS